MPVEALREVFGKERLPALEQFQRLGGKSNGEDGEPGDERSYTEEHGLPKSAGNKVAFARKTATHFTIDNLQKCHDLATQMKEVCNRIRSWNNDPYRTG